MMSNLSSHDVDDLLSESDWFEWIHQLINYCRFNSDTQKIQISDCLFIITNYNIWCTVILICFKNLTFSDEKNVTNSLQVYFAIMKNALKIEQENILIDLENSTIKLIFISESDISDDFSMNICFSKWLYFAVIDEDLIFNSSADNISIIYLFIYISNTEVTK